MLLQSRPVATVRRLQLNGVQKTPKVRTSQVPGCGGLPCRLNLSCAAFNRDDSDKQSQPGDRDEDQSGWAADNISSAHMNLGNMYSHNLPWKNYSRMMFMAIEAEADSKQEMQDACDGCLKPHSDSSSIASSRSMCEDDSRFRIDAPTPSTLPPSTGFTQHVQKSMEAHDAAQQLRQAAEVEAQAFFEAMGAAPGTGDAARKDSAARPAIHSAMLLELEASMQQGMQAAHDQLIITLRVARSLLHNTQRALADCAQKLRLEMSLQPANSAAREQQAAALQQLQGLTEETMDDLAARLTSQFLPGCNLSMEEAREWLDELWLLDMPHALDSGSEEAC